MLRGKGLYDDDDEEFTGIGCCGGNGPGDIVDEKFKCFTKFSKSNMSLRGLDLLKDRELLLVLFVLRRLLRIFAKVLFLS